jgi:hypothetical protein
MVISIYRFKTSMLFATANSVIIDVHLDNKIQNKQEFK